LQTFRFKKKQEVKKIFIIIFLLITANLVNAQNSVSVKVISLTAHPFTEQNLLLHQNTINNSGTLTIEPGVILSFENFFTKKTSIRMSASVISDRYNTISGFGQLSLKYKVIKIYKHSFSVAFGPTFHYTSIKPELPTYINDNNYTVGDNLLYKISWLSGFVEYNYSLNKNVNFAATINNIHPKSLGLSLGLRIQIPNPNGKGCDCPSY